MPTIILKIAIAVLLTALFFALAGLWGLYAAIRPPRIVSSITPADLGLAYENVSFQTEDGLTLRGWFIHAALPNAKTIILLHGYPADKGNILPSLAFLQEQFNLFLFDFRYHGQSDGWYTTAGIRETADLLAAIRFLQESRGINDVGVWGFSMGGAVTLLVAPQVPEIKAIVTEAAYANLGQMAGQLYPIPGLGRPLGWAVKTWAKLLLGINPDQVSPEQASQQLNQPVLLIHSQADQTIPFTHARQLQAALQGNPRAEFWFPADLTHGEFNAEHQQRITDFFQRNL